MDNIRKSIRLIFADFCPDDILKRINKIKNDEYVNFISNDQFLEYGFDSFKHYSIDEIGNVYEKLNQDWFLNFDNGEKNYFFLLQHFNKQILVEQNLEPFVVYEHLLKWRDLSYYTGEDLLTTSYFAFCDLKSLRKRDFFSWRSTIFSDNKRLRILLKKGLAENHFHLKGSGPVFDLSWLNLMNNPTKFNEKLKLMENELVLLTKKSNSNTKSFKELKILTYKAAYIRYLLFKKIVLNDKNILSIKIDCNSNSLDCFDLLLKIGDLEKEINLLKYDVGHKFIFNGENDSVIDYAIPKNIHTYNLEKSYVFYGERKLMYECFKLIYSNNEDFKPFAHLFHAYLLIKAQFRAELIQVNDKAGFGNFSKYQDRKEYFLNEGSIYHAAFVNLAVNDTKKHMNINSFELRVAPKENVLSLKKSMENYLLSVDQKTIQSQNLSEKLKIKELLKQRRTKVLKALNYHTKENIFYTVHFIKQKDKSKKKDLLNHLFCRHHDLRKDLKAQSLAISQLRESTSPVSDKIRGVDAAASEFNTRPEVFAQAFRYLKNHKLRGHYNHLKNTITEHNLFSTFHVGEDFYDIVDGLRSIDECLYFLNFGQGDRLGHVLALGVDVKDYFDFKQNKLMLPKQIVLDNISWLLAKIREFGVSIHRNEVNRLEKIFDNLFHEIFTSNLDNNHALKNKYVHHHAYYDAWKLRGDDPYLYFDDIESDVTKKINLTYWERCRINESDISLKTIRKNLDVKRLYQVYHFNNEVKKAGESIKQFEITFEYKELVEAVQIKMMDVIKNKNIAIETNPTSNYLIGTFKRYAKHPITKFYNLGLESDKDKIMACPQISVSINTDDQGIFSTSLENEYALLAIALEKEKDKNGKPLYNSSMIYEYLERVRMMGIGQSFNN